MSVFISSPLRANLVTGTNVTFDAPLVSAISSDDIYNPEDPTQTLTEMLSGTSHISLLGSANIDGTVVGNTSILVSNGKTIPTSIIFALTAISGSGNGPSVNIGFTATDYRDYISSRIASRYVLSGGTFATPGTGVSISDVLTLSGGVVDSSDYATITLTTAKLVSATINNAGSGYGNVQTFTVNVAGGTNSVPAQLVVSTLADGTVAQIVEVSTVGNYTVLPSLIGNVVTGDNGTDHGTGLTLDLVFGARDYTISNGGTYSIRPTGDITFTGGSGAGITFNADWTDTLGMFSTINQIGQVVSNELISNYVYMSDGDELFSSVSFASTYDTYTLKVFVYGFSF